MKFKTHFALMKGLSFFMILMLAKGFSRILNASHLKGKSFGQPNCLNLDARMRIME